jgi:hypothetical protein
LGVSLRTFELANCGFKSLKNVYLRFNDLSHFHWSFLPRVFLIRFRRDAMVRMLRLTDAFIWEDLPTTDPVTGSLSMAGWIPRIQRFSFIFTTTAFAFHIVQTTIRLTTNDDRPFTYGAWYPFDTKTSPTYELINISQVRESIISWFCSLWFTLCERYPISAFWLTRLTHVEKCIWDASVLEIHNTYFCRCGFVIWQGLGCG